MQIILKKINFFCNIKGRAGSIIGLKSYIFYRAGYIFTLDNDDKNGGNMLKVVNCGDKAVDMEKNVEILKRYYIDFFGEKYADQIEKNIAGISYIIFKPFVYDKKTKEEMDEFVDTCAEPGTIENEVLHEVFRADKEGEPKERDAISAVVKKCLDYYTFMKYVPENLFIEYVTTPGVPGDEKHNIIENKMDKEFSQFVSYRMRKVQFYEKLEEAFKKSRETVASLKAIKTYIGRKHMVNDCGKAINALRAPFYAEGRKIGEQVFEDHYMGRKLGIAATMLQIREGKYIVPYMLIKEGYPNGILIHELLHGITSSNEGDAYKVGVAPGFRDSKYIALNETLTDYFATKIDKKMRENNELVGDPKSTFSAYALAYTPLAKIIDENIDLFKEAMMSSDQGYLEKHLGKYNCEKLLAIANYLLGNPRYYKPENANDILINVYREAGQTVDTKNIKGEIEKLYEDIKRCTIKEGNEKF